MQANVYTGCLKFFRNLINFFCAVTDVCIVNKHELFKSIIYFNYV